MLKPSDIYPKKLYKNIHRIRRNIDGSHPSPKGKGFLADLIVSEGLYRIIDWKGRIGYADETGKTVIRPRFAFGYPFEGGKAKVTDSGECKRVAASGDEHWYWESDDWCYIDRNGDIVGTLMQDSTK